MRVGLRQGAEHNMRCRMPATLWSRRGKSLNRPAADAASICARTFRQPVAVPYACRRVHEEEEGACERGGGGHMCAWTGVHCMPSRDVKDIRIQVN